MKTPKEVVVNAGKVEQKEVKMARIKYFLFFIQSGRDDDTKLGLTVVDKRAIDGEQLGNLAAQQLSVVHTSRNTIIMMMASSSILRNSHHQVYS